MRFLTNRLILVKSGKNTPSDLKIRIHELKNQNRFTVELLRLLANISSKNRIHQILPMVCLIRFKTCVEQ